VPLTKFGISETSFSSLMNYQTIKVQKFIRSFKVVCVYHYGNQCQELHFPEFLMLRNNCHVIHAVFYTLRISYIMFVLIVIFSL